MLTSILALAGAASAAAIVPRQAASSKCCFGINVSGGVSNGGLGQYTDGQNRVGPGYGSSEFCYYAAQGSIVDASGRGCVISSPTNQYQCDSGVTASTAANGITIAANGTISHSGSSTWYECYSTAGQGIYNIYATNPGSQALDCHPIMLTTVNSNCTSSASSSGASSSSAKPATSSAASSAKSSSAAAASSSSVKSSSASASASTGSASTRTTGTTVVVTSTVKPASSTATVVSNSTKPASTSSIVPVVSSSSKPATTSSVAPVVSSSSKATSPVAPTTTPVAPTPAVSSCVPVTVTIPASTVTVTVTAPCSSSAQVSSASASSTPVPATSSAASSSKASTASAATSSAPAVSSSKASTASAATSSAPAVSSTKASTASAATSSAPAVSSSKASSAPASSSASAASSSKVSSASVATSTAPAATASACPKGIAGQTYQYPHLIVPVNKNSPNTAYGTQYFGGVNSTFSSIFNFDIPASYAGKTCSLEMLLPNKQDLVTSDYTLTGSGAIDFEQLASVATQSTTYANQPKVAKDLGVFNITPGTSTIITSGPCAAGTTVSYELVAQDSTNLYFFEDYNPSALGLFLVAC